MFRNSDTGLVHQAVILLQVCVNFTEIKGILCIKTSLVLWPEFQRQWAPRPPLGSTNSCRCSSCQLLKAISLSAF